MDKTSAAPARRYGKWAGNPKGIPENLALCIAEVFPAAGYILHQCHRKRGHGLSGAYCKQHAKRFPQAMGSGP